MTGSVKGSCSGILACRKPSSQRSGLEPLAAFPVSLEAVGPGGKVILDVNLS